MYNPVNMKIEDEARLYERDLREKNKRKRFEVRYDVEAMTRKEGFAEQERSDHLRLNKISHTRYKVEQERGFDILTNDPLKGPGASKTVYLPKANQPRGVWTRAMQTVNREFMNEAEVQAIDQEEEQKRIQSQTDFHQSQYAMLKDRETYDPLAQTNIDRRSQRVTRKSLGFDLAKSAQASQFGASSKVDQPFSVVEKSTA